MNRQIVLDTETTGLNVADGHRIIEIGCLELIDRKLTGKKYHCYLNPEREIEAGAVEVHGLSADFLQDKPLFADVAQTFVDFISGAELIIHNASFDIGFLNHELARTEQGYKKIIEYCAVIDTLQLARKLHVGQRNNLDALCKRYSIDNTKRDFHGALLDASLLAQVYLAMTGGQGSFFDGLASNVQAQYDNTDTHTILAIEPQHLVTIKATAEEEQLHATYLQKLKDKGKCVWLEETHA